MTKYIDQHTYTFDQAYDENTTNQQIYQRAILPLVEFAFKGGKVSCFAYGQTGSGKTYTMIGSDKNPGIYNLAAKDIFNFICESQSDYKVLLSYFEIYCGKLYDLLNNRKIVKPREDGKQNINIVGLTQTKVEGQQEIFELIERGNLDRVTSTTGKNTSSSRSHAILKLELVSGGKKGLFSFIDLAGNERGGDTYGHDQQTRIDGAEISKSLLALKECIRALD